MNAAGALSAVEFNTPLPVWVVVVVGAVAVGLIVWFYRAEREAAGVGGMRWLVGLRIIGVVVAFAMIAGPGGVWASRRHSRGALYLVLDDSRSMGRVDAGREKSRAQLAEEAVGNLRGTLGEFDVSVVPMSSGHPSAAGREWLETAAEVLRNPRGGATEIGGALRAVGEKAEGPATVLVVSDGRQNRGTLPEDAAKRLAAAGSRVFTLAVGSKQIVRDAAVDSIDAPALVMAGDDVTISARVRLDGIEEQVNVSLMRDGMGVANKTVGPGKSDRVEFGDPGAPEGEHEYAVAVTPVANEATEANNRMSARVTVRREKIRVLLIEDEPRWEYRFLKSVLSADRTVELETRLLEPARIENVAAPAAEALPATKEQWSGFDVVIVGDVSPATLTAEMQNGLTGALREGKVKCVVLIAGPRNMPGRFAGMPLAGVVPVDLTRGGSGSADVGGAVVPRVAVEAEGSVLARLAPDEQMNRLFWAAIPAFGWRSEYAAIKPAAQVVWEAGEEARGERTALLSTMNFGAGRVMYLASPETWRLRYVEGPGGEAEDLHRRFWLGAVRWAVAGEGAKPSERDVEDTNLSADPGRLEAIAKAGNGAAFDASETEKLAAALPYEDHVREDVTRLGLFRDRGTRATRLLHWAVFLVFVGLMSAEWVVRKRKGLV